MGTSPAPVTPIRGRRIVAWQGWLLQVPHRWSPVRLEGDAQGGQLLMADLHRGRIGIRWQKLSRSRKFDANQWIQQALTREVGKLASAEARPLQLDDAGWLVNRLYMDPEPPGRDVWIGYSLRSNRWLQVVYHARHRDTVLGGSLVPTILDVLEQGVSEMAQQATAEAQSAADGKLSTGQDPAEDQGPGDSAVGETQVLEYQHGDICPWAIFDLSVLVPGRMKLAAQSMLAGDLKLSFIGPKQRLLVRQIAPASEAIKRQTPQQWLGEILRSQKKMYRPVGKPVEASMVLPGGRTLVGYSATLVRRRRFFWKWNEPARLESWVLADPVRDRLLVVMGAGVDLPGIVESIGWAGGPVAQTGSDGDES